MPAMGDDVSTNRGHGPLLQSVQGGIPTRSVGIINYVERGNDRLTSGSYFYPILKSRS